MVDGEVNRLCDFESGTDESESVDYEVPADYNWEDDLLDDGPGSDYNSEDDIVHNAYPDAVGLVNILSFFS